MRNYTNQMTAEDLIRYIAYDYVELSHEKVEHAYHEHMQMCREWLVCNTMEQESDEIAELNSDF